MCACVGVSVSVTLCVHMCVHVLMCCMCSCAACAHVLHDVYVLCVCMCVLMQVYAHAHLCVCVHLCMLTNMYIHYNNMCNHRAIKKANSTLVDCHKELDTFTTEHQSHTYNQPNDIEMTNPDDDKKVCKLICYL